MDESGEGGGADGSGDVPSTLFFHSVSIGVEISRHV